MPKPWNPAWGSPFVGLRLSPSVLAASKEAAQTHGTTLSGYIRDALIERLDKDGVNWRTASEPTPGQVTLDDAINA